MSSRASSKPGMHVFELTRRLIDIESITPNEREIGDFLWRRVGDMAQHFDGQVERMRVEQDRDNIFARFGDPAVVLSTHMDTVPPFIRSREDDDHIWGRGACDTKGIIASMITAAEELLAAGRRNFGLLFVVGEERNSAGARVAARNPRGSKFLINGEPTENKLALGSKGALRYEIVAHGRMAHSAYPELGESAIEKLLDALERIRRVELPKDRVLGASTLNIGTIQGGRAPNVIPDDAQAEVFIRVVGEVANLREEIAARGRAERGSTGSFDDSGCTLGRVGWISDHRRGFHNRHSRSRNGLGATLSDRSGKYSRRAHQRRAHSQISVAGECVFI